MHVIYVCCAKKYSTTHKSRIRVMALTTTFNNILVISWRSVLFVDETEEINLPVVSYWQTLSHNVVSSIPRHELDSNSQLWWVVVYIVAFHCKQYFSYIVAVNFISGGNRSTGENHISAESHWEILSQNNVSSTPRNRRDSNAQRGSFKFIRCQ
jgi:hypothetical protein